MISRNTNGLVIGLLVGVPLAIGALTFAFWPRPAPALRVLCGSSMAQPVEKIKNLVEADGAAINLDLGGSETLLPRVLAGESADVFVCHDPFEEKVRAAGQLADSVVVGVLRPVILVAPGNPKKIASVADLANEGIRLGTGDPRYSTCGELFVDLLKRKNLYDAVKGNIAFEGRSHSEIANGLITGNLDAVIVWNFVARLHKEKTQLVPTDDAYPPVNVTILGLKKSPNPRARDKFLELCRGPAVQAIFKDFGYTARD